jgi:hypothetical protein
MYNMRQESGLGSVQGGLEPIWQALTGQRGHGPVNTALVGGRRCSQRTPPAPDFLPGPTSLAHLESNFLPVFGDIQKIEILIFE